MVHLNPPLNRDTYLVYASYMWYEKNYVKDAEKTCSVFTRKIQNMYIKVNMRLYL